MVDLVYTRLQVFILMQHPGLLGIADLREFRPSKDSTRLLNYRIFLGLRGRSFFGRVFRLFGLFRRLRVKVKIVKFVRLGCFRGLGRGSWERLGRDWKRRWFLRSRGQVVEEGVSVLGRTHYERGFHYSDSSEITCIWTKLSSKSTANVCVTEA